MGGKSATTSNTAGSNDNQQAHDQRQENLQKNIDRLKKTGDVSGLIAKKNKEARNFKLNTEGIKKGSAFVKREIGYKNDIFYPTGEMVGSYALKSKKGGKGMFGEEADRATNDYLVSIGEATKSKTGSYWLTAQGRKMKYGGGDIALGSGNRKTITGNMPISKEMWDSQKSIQNLFMLGITAIGVPFSSSIMLDANSKRNSYSNYLKGFNNINGRSSASMVNRDTGMNETNNNETDNKAEDFAPDSNVIVQDASQVARELKRNHLFASLQGNKTKQFLEKSKQTIAGNMARV